MLTDAETIQRGQCLEEEDSTCIHSSFKELNVIPKASKGLLLHPFPSVFTKNKRKILEISTDKRCGFYSNRGKLLSVAAGMLGGIELLVRSPLL